MQPGKNRPLLIQEGPQASLDSLTIRAVADPVQEKRGEAISRLRMEVVRRDAELEEVRNRWLGRPDVEDAHTEQPEGRLGSIRASNEAGAPFAHPRGSRAEERGSKGAVGLPNLVLAEANGSGLVSSLSLETALADQVPSPL